MSNGFYLLNIRFDLTDERQRLIEEVRSIIREELQNMTFVSEQHSQVQAIASMLTDEEQSENEKSALDDLEMFG